MAIPSKEEEEDDTPISAVAVGENDPLSSVAPPPHAFTSQPGNVAVPIATPMSPAMSPAVSSQAGAPGSERTYRGGFHSSICDIFRDPTRRTDCCAVACCGILSSDRTRFLLTGERPPPLWQRVALYLIVPALLTAAMTYFSVEVPDDTNNSRGNPYYDPNSTDDGATRKVSGLFWLLWAYLLLLGCYERARKRAMRKAIMMKLYRDRVQARGQEVDPLQLSLFLKRHRLDLLRAYSSYSCCYANDNEVLLVATDADEHQHRRPDGDFCTCLWQCLSSTFWDSLCGCWCQCCGICAIAQEEREVDRMMGTQSTLMDYVTFQPYSEYFPAIQSLRENQVNNLVTHLKTISILSSKLLKNMVAVLVILTLFALSDMDSNFTFENMVVLFMTLGQAFFIEYLVHWRWNRFDLSFDAVVKYFACGFLLTTPMAIVFELIVSTVASMILFLVLGVLIADSDLAQQFEDDQQKAMKQFAIKYQGLFIAFIFVNSFVVAALVEEMVKYFGYWMVVVPDLLPQEATNNVPGVDNQEDDCNEEESMANDDSSHPPIPNNCTQATPKSISSIGSGTTVAMVSVALGFACCENLMYIFVYSPPSFGVEISTLLARSLFPVHPLCAAIQSIGVCKRDLEGDRSHRLGRIISPAVLLHGSFDFVLMVAAFLQQLNTIEEGADDDGGAAAAGNDDEDISESLAEQLPALIMGVILVITGYVYYVNQSRSQSRRLLALDGSVPLGNTLLV